MSKKIISKDKIKKVKENIRVIINFNYDLSRTEINLIFEFYRSLADKGYVLLPLFDDDKNKGFRFIEKVFDFATKHQISAVGILDYFKTIDIAGMKAFHKLLISDDIKKFPELSELSNERKKIIFDETSLIQEIEAQIELRFNEYNYDTCDFPTVVMQEILDNSYDEIIKQFKKGFENYKLPLKNYKPRPHIENKIIDEIVNEQSQFNELFTNKRIFAKIKANNHFMSNLMKDNIIITDDDNIVFENHTKALSMGYTQKAILLSINKEVAIRELQTKIKHLQDFKTYESEKLIKFCNDLVNFIHQHKYSNYIPFKALAKYLGLTKNQAKNYAKQIISFNEKTFLNTLDDLNLLDNN